VRHFSDRRRGIVGDECSSGETIDKPGTSERHMACVRAGMAMNATHEGSVSQYHRTTGTGGSDDPAVLLDRTFARLTSAMDDAEVRVTFANLLDSLDGVRESLDGESWQSFIATIRQHPLHELVLTEEPYTRRAFLKPRGYAGDAELLDYVYSGAPRQPMTARGSALFRAAARESHAVQAVRARKDLLARMVDETAAKKPRPRVLSLACGHLREAEVARSVQAGLVEYVAADQDPQSLDEVARCFAKRGVTTANVSVRSVVRGETAVRDFDFVYAAGLYDYLAPDVARRLTKVLFDATAPGGRLLVANFVPDHPGRAYMEAFMDWNLVYRTRDELRMLTAGIDERSIDSARVFQFEPCVAYLEVTRRQS
jgi:extracellular factor (EF) 3-hydroxypalmitic acid methyl ester biosynthesis protein